MHSFRKKEQNQKDKKNSCIQACIFHSKKEQISCIHKYCSKRTENQISCTQTCIFIQKIHKLSCIHKCTL